MHIRRFFCFECRPYRWFRRRRDLKNHMIDGAHRRGHYQMFLTEKAEIRKHTSAAKWLRIEYKRFNNWCRNSTILKDRWWGRRKKHEA